MKSPENRITKKNVQRTKTFLKRVFAGFVYLDLNIIVDALLLATYSRPNLYRPNCNVLSRLLRKMLWTERRWLRNWSRSTADLISFLSVSLSVCLSVCLSHRLPALTLHSVLVLFIIPAKAREYVFTGVGLCVCLSVCVTVCLSVTTITKRLWTDLHQILCEGF